MELECLIFPGKRGDGNTDGLQHGTAVGFLRLSAIIETVCGQSLAFHIDRQTVAVRVGGYKVEQCLRLQSSLKV